jgi:hypothetical protein
MTSKTRKPTKRRTPAAPKEQVVKPPRGVRIPHCLFSCSTDHCAEERSWPARDIHWVETWEGWYCDLCIDQLDHDVDIVVGISLKDWLSEIGQPV